MSATCSADRRADVYRQYVRCDGAARYTAAENTLMLLLYVKKYISVCKFNDFHRK